MILGVRLCLYAWCVFVMAVQGAAKAETRVDIDAARSAFDLARQERADGSYASAIDRLRMLVRQFPGDNDVREELGYALILDKQFASAQFHFQLLAERSADPRRRALYRAVLQRILSDRPAGVRLVLEVVPSSNINRGSDTDQVDTFLGLLPITDESQAQRGWRRTFGLEGFLRKGLGARDQLIFDWEVLNTAYSNDILPEATQFGGTLTWRHFTAKGNVQLSFGQTRIRTGDERITQNTIGVAGGRILGVGQTRFDWSFTRSLLDFEDQSGRSGPFQSLTLRHTWLLPRSQSVFAGVVLEDATPELAHQRYDGAILQVGGRKVFRTGTLVEAILSVGTRDFRGVFPGQSFDRFDRFEELSISAQDSRIRYKGFTPRVTCTVRKNGSNVSLFEATTQECGFEITRRF